MTTRKKVKYILVYDVASTPDHLGLDMVIQRYVKDKVVLYDTKGDPTIRKPEVMTVEEDRIVKTNNNEH